MNAIFRRFWTARPNWLVLMFLLVCGFTGLRLVYLTPIGQVADEPSHIARAAALTRGIVIGRKVLSPVGKVSGVMVDQGLIDASVSELVPPGSSLVIPQARRDVARRIRWANRLSFDPASNSLEYLPIFYLPGSLGIGVGHWLGQSPLQALYTGRLFMLLGFLLMGGLALQTARFGRPLLFAFLAVPMTLSLGASFNQDGMLIAACVLCVALLTEADVRAPKARWIAAAIFAAVICSKPPYGFLLFCALIPLRWRGLGRRLLRLSLFAIPAIIWVVVMLHTSFTPYWRTPYHPGPLWSGKAGEVFTAPNASANLYVLIGHPLQFIMMPYHATIHNFKPLVYSFFGAFGWLSILMADPVYHFWELALAAAALANLAGSSVQAVPWRLIDALWVLGLAVVTVILMELSLYLSWTDVGATIITGVQGRYFLEIVPFLVLALPRLGGVINRISRWRYAAVSLETVLTLPVVTMTIYDGFYLPHLIYARFS